MPSLVSLRKSAFHAQAGRCYYCERAMWLSSPSEIGLRLRTARPFQCTAEHLIACQDGGRTVARNVVAACCLCNARRHKRKKPPTPEAYKALVRRQVGKGKWWPVSLSISGGVHNVPSIRGYRSSPK